MDVTPLVAAIEEGGLSFILFGVMVVIIWIALLITIPK